MGPYGDSVTFHIERSNAPMDMPTSVTAGVRVKGEWTTTRTTSTGMTHTGTTAMTRVTTAKAATMDTGSSAVFVLVLIAVIV